MNDPEGDRRRYRCYLIHQGRIAKAQELAEASLAEAIAQGHRLLTADAGTTADSGIEIWERAKLRYSDQRHAGDTGRSDPILSPFQTPECTMMPKLHRSTSRSLAMLTFIPSEALNGQTVRQTH